LTQNGLGLFTESVDKTVEELGSFGPPRQKSAGFLDLIKK
jgi:hypothetical protein